MELDYEQYKLVREALHERKIFLQTAPYLSHMLPIMLPLYKYALVLGAHPMLRNNVFSDIGRSLITMRGARCTIYWPEKRTWRARISCQRAKH